MVEGNRRGEGLVSDIEGTQLCRDTAEIPCSRARKKRGPRGDAALNKEILEHVDRCLGDNAMPERNSEMPYREVESLVAGSSLLISHREILSIVIRAWGWS